jgi:hypothetical protein
MTICRDVAYGEALGPVSNCEKEGLIGFSKWGIFFGALILAMFSESCYRNRTSGAGRFYAGLRTAKRQNSIVNDG